jgi:hypothetical protein
LKIKMKINKLGEKTKTREGEGKRDKVHELGMAGGGGGVVEPRSLSGAVRQTDGKNIWSKLRIRKENTKVNNWK